MPALTTLRRRPTTLAPGRRGLDPRPRSGALTTAADVLALQRAAGNRTTASLLTSVQRLPVTIESDAPDTADEKAFEKFVWGIERSKDMDRLERLYHWLVLHYDDDPTQTDQIVRLATLVEDILTGERSHPDDVAKQLVAEQEQKEKAAAAKQAKAEKPKRPVKKPAPAKPTEKQLKEAERDRQRQAEKLAEQQEQAKERAKWDLEAPMYWQNIQNEPGNAGHGGSLKFLILQGYLEVKKPHRCFLSRWERQGGPNGPRAGKRFGLSLELVPRGVLTANPGQRLVVHLHCGDDGQVLGGGIKFMNAERLPGDNILLEAKFVDYLRRNDINGDNVNAIVGNWS